jgi:hypothetical protein
MALDKKELEKLLPEERIKKLREFEQKLVDERRRESAEIEALLKKSMEDLHKDDLAKKLAPKDPRANDIASVFTKEEMEAISTPRRKQAEEPEVSYRTQKQLLEDYSSIKEMLGYELTPGSLDREQIRRIEDIRGRILKSSYQSLSHSDQTAVLVSATKEALYRVRKYSGLE